MDPIVVDLLVIALLIVVNAAFAGTELAVVSLRRSQLVRLSDEHGRRGRTLLMLSEQPTQFLSTIQVGITLAGFLASAFAAVSLAEPVEEWLAFLGNAAPASALVLVTLALTFVSLVFGELVPKRVAMRRPERWALVAAVPVAMVARFARPLVWLLSRSTDLVARAVGGGAQHDTDGLLTDEEVLDVIATEADITPARRALVAGALEIETRTLRDVLVPRRDVLVLDSATSIGAAARSLADAGHSRAPVAVGADLDDLVGIAVLAALVAFDDADAPVGQCCSEPLVLPDGSSVHGALHSLQRERRQLALVADEHGTIVGIVTVEDLLEEIVGELYDELDRDLAPDDPRGYRHLPDGSFELPGTYPVHDLPDLGLDVGSDVTASTVAGALMDALGHLPAVDEVARVGRVELRALQLDGTAIERVHARGT